MREKNRVALSCVTANKLLCDMTEIFSQKVACETLPTKVAQTRLLDISKELVKFALSQHRELTERLGRKRNIELNFQTYSGSSQGVLTAC